jgi:hypothetical protein
VNVQASTLFEAADAGVAQLRQGGWPASLPPDATIQVEVHVPPVIHAVPLKAVERWANGPSVSPKEELIKRPVRRG